MTTASDLIVYSPTEQAIAAMRSQFAGLTIRDIKDTAGYKAVHDARILVRDARVMIEKQRKGFKAEALEYGRQVDAKAKQLFELLEPIESHLSSEEKRIDDEKEAIKNAARLKAEAEARAKQEAEAAAFRAEQERVAAERRKLDEERAELEAEKLRIQEEEAARQRAIAAAAAAEKAKVETEQRRLADAERERQHAAEVERARAETAERVRIETETRLRRQDEEAAAAEKRRADAKEAKRLKAEELRPDREKLASVAVAVREIAVPTVSSEAAEAARRIYQVLLSASKSIELIANELT